MGTVPKQPLAPHHRPPSLTSQKIPPRTTTTPAPASPPANAPRIIYATQQPNQLPAPQTSKPYNAIHQHPKTLSFSLSRPISTAPTPPPYSNTPRNPRTSPSKTTHLTPSITSLSFQTPPAQNRPKTPSFSYHLLSFG